MARILLAYSTVDGHTRTICERLRRSLEMHGHAATLTSLSDPARPDVDAFDQAVIGASIRYGKYRRELYDFIDAQRTALDARPTAFFSVNVVARKPGKDTPDTNPYVQRFLRETTWRPVRLAVFAGRIDYPRYGFLDRNVIRLIMAMTHGPTDPRATVDFTNWDAVDAFAGQLS